MTDLDINILKNLMVEISEGEIILRDDRIKHNWCVKIKPFFLAKYLVTQELYFQIQSESPSNFKGAKLPVETVSWRDAVTFCNNLSIRMELKPVYIFSKKSEEISFDQHTNGYRLPSEAEWEYACKAGSTGIRYGEIDSIAWYKNNADKITHEVGLKVPNSWGLYDMLGNVWEWCNDIYDETIYGSYRVIRGGGWYDEERGCMATNRRRSHPRSFKIDDLGFRIARNQGKS